MKPQVMVRRRSTSFGEPWVGQQCPAFMVAVFRHRNIRDIVHVCAPSLTREDEHGC